MRLRTKIILVILAIIISWIVFAQFQEYQYPSVDNINKRLNYLERVVSEPLDNESEILRLGVESEEFMLFSYAYTVYAATNLCMKDSLYKERTIPLIKESINKVLKESIIYRTYGVEESLTDVDGIPDYSVLYLGHLNLMMGCYRALSNDTTFDRLNDHLSTSLYNRYSRVEFLSLESYPMAIWIPDNTVALASLKMHSTNTGSEYDTMCEKWVKYAKENLLEENTQTLYSRVNPHSGMPTEEPRGSMLGWSIMFIYQFDEEFAVDLYDNYKQYFSCDWLIVRAFKERYNSSETDAGDIDSGPVFLGYSIPASEFALGCSVLSGDFKIARKLERLIALGTSESGENDEFKYKVRFVDMNISPMAEALVLFYLTITKWVSEGKP